MYGKVASFMMSLVLIGWQVLDIVKGKAGALTWVLLGVFSLMGLFELIDLASSGHTADADENKEPEKQSASA